MLDWQNTDPPDLAVIEQLIDRYDLATDAEYIFDEEAFKRGYAFSAHRLARQVPGLLAEVYRLRARLAEPEREVAPTVPRRQRVIVVVDWPRQRVHGITTDQAQAQDWVRQIAAKYGGNQLAATMTADAIEVAP
jgi:hypothetical protein